MRVWLALIFSLLVYPIQTRAQEQINPFDRVAERLTPGVTVLRRVDLRMPGSIDAPFEGNIVVFEQSDGLVVVDAGGAPTAGQIAVEAIRRLSAKPVKFLIYTHFHGDHNLGAPAFLAAWPSLRVISTSATREHMLGRPMAYVATYDASTRETLSFAQSELARADLDPAFREGWGHVVRVSPAMIDAYRGMTARAADITFEQRMTIPDPDTPLEIVFLGRGNTDGDAVVWAPRQRVLAAGDLVVEPIPYGFGSYPGEWIATLDRLRAYDFAFLIPGHGRVMTDSAYVEQVQQAISEVRRQVTPLAQEGLSVEDIWGRVRFRALADRFVGPDPWRRDVFLDFFLDPMVRNVRKEARGEPIIQGPET